MSKSIKIAAAGAVAVVGPTAAVADEFVPSYEIMLEGGVLLSEFTSQSFDKVGDPFDTDFGGYGSIAVGSKFDGMSPYDWRVTGTISRFMENVESYAESNVLFSAGTHRLGYEAVDFDIGRRIYNDNVEARIYAGVRGIHTNFEPGAGFDKIGDGYLDVDKMGSSEFYGVGPRAGANVRVGSDWALVGGLSGSVMYGKRNSKLSFEYEYDDFTDAFGPYEYDGTYTDSEFDWMADLAAEVGVSFRPGERTEVIAGYRAHQIWNVAGEYLGGDGDDNALMHGPFLRFNLKF